MGYIPDKYMSDVIAGLGFPSGYNKKQFINAAKEVRSRALKSEAQKIKKRIVSETKMCEICGFSYKPILQIHHIVPISEFGNNQNDNIICVCPNCHKTLHHLYSVFNSDLNEEDDGYGHSNFDVVRNMNRVLLRYVYGKCDIFHYFETIGVVAPIDEEQA